MLTITLAINGRKIGSAHARNISDLADISDYDVAFLEYANPQSGSKLDTKGTFTVEGHPRNQSAWALVREIAIRIAPPTPTLGETQPYNFQADVATKLADLNITASARAMAANLIQSLRGPKTRGARGAKPPCRCISYNRPDWGGDVDEIVVTVPPHIRAHTDGRETVCLDLCIAPLVIMLWAHGIPTLGSCCSHCGRVSREVIVLEADAKRARIIADAMGDDAEIAYWAKTGSIVRIIQEPPPAVVYPRLVGCPPNIGYPTSPPPPKPSR